MPEEGRSDKKTRAWSKCSKCREKKLKCEPENRNWEADKQKCVYCQIHNLPCGPDYTKDQDPGVGPSTRGGGGQDAPSPEFGGSQQNSQQSMAVTPILHTVQDDSPFILNIATGPTQQASELSPATTTSPRDRRVRILALSDDDLRAKALSKLERLNVLGTALLFELGLAPVSCHGFGGHEEYNNMANTISTIIREEIHCLFIYIYDLASQADTRTHAGLAQEIMLKLLLALERYPGLCDGKKRGALLKIAFFFQRNNDLYEFEHILGKVADLYETPMLPLHPNPYPLLAESFSKTSEKAREVLVSLWHEKFGVDAPVNLAIPPLQRAAQRSNVDVTLAVLQRPETHHSAPAMLDQQALHIAAASGCLQTLHQLINTGVILDARDLHSRTPLFLAAGNGHEQCCEILLTRGADPNARNAHGHSIMEVAAQGGFLSVIRQLIAWGGNVNPLLGACSSTPLQAAVESSNFSYDLVQYLVDANADVSSQRLDGKNAIELAEERGLTMLADSLRQKKREQETQFSQTNLSPQDHLSPQAHLSPFGQDYSVSFDFGSPSYGQGFT